MVDESLSGLDSEPVEPGNAQIDRHGEQGNNDANQRHIEPAPALHGRPAASVLLLADFSLKV